MVVWEAVGSERRSCVGAMMKYVQMDHAAIYICEENVRETRAGREPWTKIDENDVTLYRSKRDYTVNMYTKRLCSLSHSGAQRIFTT